MRDMMLLGTACAAGVVVSPQMPYVGLPVAAAASAGLAFRGRLGTGVIACAAGALAAALAFPEAAAFVVPAVAAVLLAVPLLKRYSAQLVAVMLTVAMSLGAAAADVLSARAVGLSLTGALREQAVAVTNALQQVLGTGASAWAEQLDFVRGALLMLWPSFYVQTAIYASVLVIAAIAWAARRSDTPVDVPAIRDLDLSVHALWALVVGLVLVAAAPILGEATYGARMVGFNLLYIARTLFFLQGIAVFSAVFDVPKTGFAKMVMLYVVLWVFDQFLLIVSLIGMLDFWANFRKLPRDGVSVPVPAEESPGEYRE